MAVDYVSDWTTKLSTDHGNYELLWGDRVQTLGAQGARTEVRARGMRGWVETAALGGSSLLEMYVIDVGQGDGVLLKTPDNLWHLVDAGVACKAQDIGKGAPNFIRWKFIEDLRRQRVELENVFVSHSDFDHFGGFIDLLAGKLPPYGPRPAREFPIRVTNLYHNGMGRFQGADPLGRTRPGHVPAFPQPDRGLSRDASFIVELLGDKGAFANPARPFNTRSDFDEFAALVGSVPQNVRRMSSADQHVPGYGPGQNAVTMHVLGPVVEDIGGGTRGLRWLGSASKTRNGHSIVLRVDYGNARFLLTGDLNKKSQQLLLSYHPELEFSCDVAKACHHGSADVDMEFLKAMGARVTCSSSGDNESYAHPRPRVLGASAMYGREAVDHRNRHLPPLLYSTELARSTRLDLVKVVETDIEDGGTLWTYTTDPADSRVRAKRDDSNDPIRELGTTPIATDLVYGLVNVRTDGNHILCATMHERGNKFDKEIVRAGVSPSP